MITLAQVKINNTYDWIKNVAPTVAEKAPAYSNNETWLDLSTGYSYMLTDETVGTWERIEIGYDAKIEILKNPVFMNAIRYLQNPFTIFRDDNYADEYGFDFPDFMNREERYNLNYFDCIFSECTFDSTGETITVGDDVYGTMDSFQDGDIILVAQSRRNNGYYTIDSKTDTVITVEEDLTDSVGACFIFLVDIPEQIKYIIGRMIWYDVYKRNN